MANYTGLNVIVEADVTKYQPDAFGFGIAAVDTTAVNYFEQTNNDILRRLRIEWFSAKDSDVEMEDTRVNLDQFERCGVYLFLGRFMLPALTKFRSEADKDRFERMAEYYMTEFNKEFQSILEDGVEYDGDDDGVIGDSEKVTLHGYNRLIR